MADRVTLELVLNELRRCHFAVLATVDNEGMSHSAGVSYGASSPGARNIANNPAVSLVIPVPRPLLWFVPPATIQLHGRADILDETDKGGIDVFSHFWMGRRILNAYEQFRLRGETRICFIKITPDPVIHTYMVGYSIWEIRRRMESGAGRVVIPQEQLHGDSRLS